MCLLCFLYAVATHTEYEWVSWCFEPSQLLGSHQGLHWVWNMHTFAHSFCMLMVTFVVVVVVLLHILESWANAFFSLSLSLSRDLENYDYYLNSICHTKLWSWVCLWMNDTELYMIITICVCVWFLCQLYWIFDSHQGYFCSILSLFTNALLNFE